MKGVWATPAAREKFTPTERGYAVEDYEEHGPQLFAGGAGFAYYHCSEGRTLVLAERDGRASLMTLEEVKEEQRRLWP